MMDHYNAHCTYCLLVDVQRLENFKQHASTLLNFQLVHQVVL